jgi:hypothetical protein
VYLIYYKFKKIRKKNNKNNAETETNNVRIRDYYVLIVCHYINYYLNNKVSNYDKICFLNTYKI